MNLIKRIRSWFTSAPTPDVLKESDINGICDSALFVDGRFPHCDPRVLHAPYECEICDEYASAAQNARINRGINFTGHTDADKTLCPADIARGFGNADKWYGNRPQKS